MARKNAGRVGVKPSKKDHHLDRIDHNDHLPDSIALRIGIFLLLLLAFFFLFMMLSRPGVYDKVQSVQRADDNIKDILVPDDSLGINISDAAIDAAKKRMQNYSYEISGSDKNSIDIYLTNVTVSGSDLIFSFNYTVRIDTPHICAIGFLFDGIHKDKFDRKVVLLPDRKTFSLRFSEQPAYHTSEVFYSCKVE